jgi:hypothetical protein
MARRTTTPPALETPPARSPFVRARQGQRLRPPLVSARADDAVGDGRDEAGPGRLELLERDVADAVEEARTKTGAW